MPTSAASRSTTWRTPGSRPTSRSGKPGRSRRHADPAPAGASGRRRPLAVVARSAFRTMNLMPQTRQGADAAASRPVKLACHGLWKIYGPNPDATLEVAEGEIFIIMGLSGSGKSTIVRCLSRLIEPTAGTVGFEGRD